MQLFRKTHATLACRITNFHYGRYIKKKKPERLRYMTIDVYLKSMQQFLQRGQRVKKSLLFCHNQILDEL